MQENPPTAPGMIGWLRTLGAGAMAGIHERVELLAIELQEEKYRLIQTFVWIGAVLFAGAMTVLFASIALVVLFWDTARLAVIGGLTAFYGLAFAVAVVAFRRYLSRLPLPLASTLEELKEDDACFRNGS